MNSTTTIGTENEIATMQVEEIHKQDNYSDASQLVLDEEELETRANNENDQYNGNMSKLVRTLLATLRFYAEGGHDSGQKARKAIKLYKGLKYVS